MGVFPLFYRTEGSYLSLFTKFYITIKTRTMAVVHEVQQGQFATILGNLTILNFHLNFTLTPQNNAIMWVGYEYKPGKVTPGPITPDIDPCAVFNLLSEQFRTGSQPPTLTLNYDKANTLITLSSGKGEINMVTGGDKGEHSNTYEKALANLLTGDRK